VTKESTILKKVNKMIREQHSNVDQFFNSQRATISDLYQINLLNEKRDQYVDKIEDLIKQKKFFSEKSPEYAQILSQLFIETELLRASNNEINKYMQLLNEQTGIQLKISGRMIEAKKRMDKILPPFK